MKIVFLDPSSLTPYANNAKDHPTEQIDKIAGQISAFGFDQPIVVDKNKVIIKGHGRREASLRLGLKEVPVVIADHLTEYEVKAARLADNQVATLGRFDTNKLRLELGTLSRQDFDMKLTGFELKPIEDLLNQGEIKIGERSPSVNNGPAKEKQEAEPVKNKLKEELEKDNLDEESKFESQYIVTITCNSEEEMKLLYEELNGRNLDVKLIT